MRRKKSEQGPAKPLTCPCHRSVGEVCCMVRGQPCRGSASLLICDRSGFFGSLELALHKPFPDSGVQSLIDFERLSMSLLLVSNHGVSEGCVLPKGSLELRPKIVSLVVGNAGHAGGVEVPCPPETKSGQRQRAYWQVDHPGNVTSHMRSAKKVTIFQHGS